MPDIVNYQVYNDRMRRSMWDKAFFMDKVAGAEVIIDYGCADGSLVRFLSALFPSMRFIGFDIDPAMVEAANANRGKNTFFFSTMGEVRDQLKRMQVRGSQCAVIFSSVFHEVFHYGYDLSKIRDFLSAISPQYLVVRDMLYDSADDNAILSKEAERRVREKVAAGQIQSFEEQYGSIRAQRNLIHFLLKYQYTENWDRECAENYFSCTLEKLLRVLDPAGQYRRILFHQYVLPWFRHTVETEFNIDLGEGFTTHFSMILSKAPENKMIPIQEGDAIDEASIQR